MVQPFCPQSRHTSLESLALEANSPAHADRHRRHLRVEYLLAFPTAFHWRQFACTRPDLIGACPDSIGVRGVFRPSWSLALGTSLELAIWNLELCPFPLRV